MAVSQPLALGDKLREAIIDAQNVLNSMELKGKLKIDVVGGDGAGGIESSMDRTEKSARDAAEKSIMGTEGTGPLGMNDKLVDALQRLLKGLETATGQNGSSGGRRKKGGGMLPGSSEGEDGEPGGPGYVNPYLLQGLIQNPIGTTQNAFTSMLMGGAGAGLKAPGWLMSMLAGSGGTFQPGAALASETGLLGAGASGTFASAGMIAAAKVAVPIAAFAGTMHLQNAAAEDRMSDAKDYVEDLRYGNTMGMNWRKGAWDGPFQSRQGIWQKDIKEIFSGMNVGVGGLTGRNGDSGAVDLMNNAANLALNIGVSPGQMGSVLGAGVRSGTLGINGPDGKDQTLRYLALIEEWTRKGSVNGLSTAESLARMAELSQGAQRGAGLLTDANQRSILSMDARVRESMPESLKRTGTADVMNSLGGEASGETQQVMLMNEYLGSNGNLNSEGEAQAQAILGPDQVAAMKKSYGQMAGVMIAKQLIQTQGGRARARVSGIRKLRGAGVSGTATASLLMGGDARADALALQEAEMNPNLLAPSVRASGSAINEMNRDGLEGTENIGLAQRAQVETVRSGLMAASADALIRLEQGADRAARALVSVADHARMGDLPASGTPIPNPYLGNANQPEILNGFVFAPPQPPPGSRP
jgi:hypothetical protein